MPNSSAVMRRHNLDIIYETEHLAPELLGGELCTLS